MTVAFTNFASTLTTSVLNPGGTAVTVTPSTGVNFPGTAGGQWFYATLVDSLTAPTKREIVKVTVRSSDNFSTIVRAQDGTSSLTWPAGTILELRLTKGTFNDLTLQYANNADNLSALASAVTARTNLGLGTIATQAASAVAITGGVIDGTAIGGTVPAAVAATTISATGAITSTLATGTAPLVVASTTVVGNLNVSQLLGATWTAPGTIGSVTPSSGAFTTLAASGAVSGAGFDAYLASPPAIGGATPAAGTFTTLRATTLINYRGGDNASASNSGFGETALDSNSGGISNTAIGYQALTANTSGNGNTATGVFALVANTTGSYNSAYGTFALQSNKTGTYNIAFGNNSMASGVTPSYNIAIGDNALENTGKTVTAGSFLIGATYTIQSAGSTVFTIIGAADNNPGTVFTCTGLGVGTGTASSNTDNNVGIGYQALQNNITGQYNTGIGYRAAGKNTHAPYNSAIGFDALYNNLHSSANTAVGFDALQTFGAAITAGAFVVGKDYVIQSIGSTNFMTIGAATNGLYVVFTATGVGAGTGTASIYLGNNTAIGSSSMRSLTDGFQNTAVGGSTLFVCTTGDRNAVVGHSSFYGTTTGSRNSGIGYLSGYQVTTGSENTAIGTAALFNTTIGNNNIGIGGNSGATLQTGSNNTIIGHSADTIAAADNSTALGYQATANASNQVVIGNASVTKIRGMADNLTDLGETSFRLKNVYVGTSVKLSAVAATVVEGDIYNETGQRKHASFCNGLAGWFERCIWSGYAVVTHTGIVTSQSMFTGTAKGTLTLPANFWSAGKALRVRLQGWYTTDAAPGTATIVIKFGSTTYRTTGAFTLDASVTAGFWSMDFAVVCQSSGVGGTLNGACAWLHAETSVGSQPMMSESFTTTAAVTYDTTASGAFDVLWSASDAGTVLEVTTARVWEVC